MEVAQDKQALKFIKKTVGTHIWAKRKHEELRSILPARKEGGSLERLNTLSFPHPAQAVNLSGPSKNVH